MRLRFAALAALAALTFLLTACDGSSGTATTQDYAVPADGGVALAEPGTSNDLAAPQADARGSVGTDATTSTAVQRQVVRSGSMSIQADDVPKAVMSIRTLTAAAKGFITQENSSASGDNAYSSITAQVPAAALDGFIASVSKLGTVESVDISAQDVTSQTVDLDARIRALQTSVDRMTELMAQATQVSDLLTIEAQLSARQAELDALKAQRTYLGEQVAMSTLSVTVSPVPTTKPVDTPGFVSGLEEGWNALVSAVAVGLTALGFFLPFLLLLAVIGIPLTLVCVWLVRRHRRRTTERANELRAAGVLAEPVDSAPQP